MYGYYALRAARIRVPRTVQQSITLMQLIQMIIGCYINVAAYHRKQEGYSCATSNNNIIISLLMYASYFALFAHFFYYAYLSKKDKKSPTKRE
jgi:elongation of very long chain fatty acids protein 6